DAAQGRRVWEDNGLRRAGLDGRRPVDARRRTFAICAGGVDAADLGGGKRPVVETDFVEHAAEEPLRARTAAHPEIAVALQVKAADRLLGVENAVAVNPRD